MPEAPQGRRPDWTARRALLIGRLFQGLDDARAEAVRRDLRRRGPDAVASALEAVSHVRRVRVADEEALAGAGHRLLCLLSGERTVLVETAGGRGWYVDPGDGRAPRLVSPGALSRLLPCQVLVPVVGDPAPGTSTDQRLPVAAVYLRLMVQLLGLTTPIAMMLIIDKVVSQGAHDTLVALLIGVASLTVFQYLFSLAHVCLASRQAEADALPARRRVLAALLDSSTGRAWSSPGWDAVQSSAEAGRFKAETRPQMVADCLHLLLLGLLMACFSPVLLAVSLAFLPLYVAVESWGNRRAGPHAAVSASLRNQLSTHFLESVAAGEALRAMALEDHVLGHWDALDGRLAGARYRSTLCRRLSALGVEFLQRVSVIVIMLLGVSAVLGGVMTLGQYIAFNLLSMQLAQPALRLAGYRRARADHELQHRARRRLEEDCRSRAWPAAGDRRVAVLDSPVLTVEGLAAAASGATGPSFVLTGGDWLGVVGRSGCGKTTLLRMLAGLERPGRGLALLNGVPISTMERASRSRRIRLVPQEPVVFSAPVAENIRLGDPAAAPAQILAAAQVCGLGELLARLPEHLDTVVGAAGRPMSGGERQRIALARAILSRPDVLLLDEATAALDARSEAALLTSLRRWLPGAAVVVVSHRASTLAGCGRVISLDRASPDASDRRRPVVEVLRAVTS